MDIGADLRISKLHERRARLKWQRNHVGSLFGQHARRPVVSDKIERGDITGVLEQSFVYLCERPGTYAIPRLTIAWFDLDASTLQKKVLAGVSFAVEPDPKATAAKNGAVTTGLAPIWTILIALCGLGIATWCLRHRIKSYLQAHHERDAVWLARVHTACQQNDARATLAALMRCLDRARGAKTTPTATRWAADNGDPDLEREVATLHRAFVTGEAWDGEGLRRKLPRKITLDPIASAREHQVLGGLNPS